MAGVPDADAWCEQASAANHRGCQAPSPRYGHPWSSRASSHPQISVGTQVRCQLPRSSSLILSPGRRQRRNSEPPRTAPGLRADQSAWSPDQRCEVRPDTPVVRRVGDMHMPSREVLSFITSCCLPM